MIVSGSNKNSITYHLVGTLIPITTDGGSLGSVSLNWSDLFFDSGVVINLNNGNVTLTHTSKITYILVM